MNDLVQTAMSFPTVVLTTLVGLSLLYWLMVILGALDIDIGGDGSHGHVDIDVGGGHGHVDIDTGGHVDAGGHGHDIDHGHDVDHGHGSASFLSAIGFTRVPITISFSVWWMMSWLLCLLGNRMLGPVAGTALPGWALAGLIMLAVLILTIPVTNVVTRPLAPLFVIHEAHRKVDYVGQTCTVKTGRVDREFGQADLVDGGDHLIIEVRCDKADRFERGDKALIIEFDQARDAYVIEPMDEVLARGEDQGS